MSRSTHIVQPELPVTPPAPKPKPEVLWIPGPEFAAELERLTQNGLRAVNIEARGGRYRILGTVEIQKKVVDNGSRGV